MIERERTAFRSGEIECVCYVHSARGWDHPPARHRHGARVRQYPCSHFDFYRDDVRRRVVTDPIDFLEANLASTSAHARTTMSPQLPQ